MIIIKKTSLILLSLALIITLVSCDSIGSYTNDVSLITDDIDEHEIVESVGERESEGIKPSKFQVNNSKVYDRVVIIGVDGAGGAFEIANCPNFKNIFSKGSINYHGISQKPTISAENWGSMMYGVSAETHKKTNDIIANSKHLDTSLPSVIKTYSLLYPNNSYYSVVSWKPINYGLFENFESFTKENASDLFPNLNYYDTDVKVCDLAINRIKNYDDKITFIHFVSVDGAGHSYGGNSQQYFDSITAVDLLIGKLYDTYLEEEKIHSTLFICVSDHGHTSTGGHGGETEEEKTVTLAVYGDNNNIINGSSGKFVTHDLASIVLYALGVVQPEWYEGGVPQNLFTTI